MKKNIQDTGEGIGARQLKLRSEGLSKKQQEMLTQLEKKLPKLKESIQKPLDDLEEIKTDWNNIQDIVYELKGGDYEKYFMSDEGFKILYGKFTDLENNITKLSQLKENISLMKFASNNVININQIISDKINEFEDLFFNSLSI